MRITGIPILCGYSATGEEPLSETTFTVREPAIRLTGRSIRTSRIRCICTKSKLTDRVTLNMRVNGQEDVVSGGVLGQSLV